MTSRKLLLPGSFPANPNLRFADHTLLTETISKPYALPPHIPGPGILTMISGTGRFTVPLGTQLSPGDTVLVGERWF